VPQSHTGRVSSSNHAKVQGKCACRGGSGAVDAESKRRSLVVEESSAAVVRGGGADQCLSGSQYHKNSERVGRCWWSNWRGDGDGGGDARLVGLVVAAQARPLAAACPNACPRKSRDF